MSIVSELVECQRSIQADRAVAKNYNENLSTYTIDKYQAEFFQYMKEVHSFMGFENKVELNGVVLRLTNISKLANWPRTNDWNMCNLTMLFSVDNEKMLSVTVDDTDIIKVPLSNSAKDVVGVEFLTVSKESDDEENFLKAVNAFKYTMENIDEVLAMFSKNTKNEYLTIINDSYYRNLYEIQKAKDLEQMMEMYMKNPATYVPFETPKIESPDYSNMTVEELEKEFYRKSNSDDIEVAIDELGRKIMGYFPNLQISEITDFYKQVSDNATYIDNASSEELLNLDTVNIENNGFVYIIRPYASSSQMLFDIQKDGQNIGSLYYWKQYNKGDIGLYFHTSHLGAGRPSDYRGFSGETIPVFVAALKNLEDNWSNIVTKALDTFSQALNAVLETKKQEAKIASQEKERATKKYAKREEDFIKKYF